MGGGTKEASLLEAIRNGDSTNAIKILNKNSSLIKNKSAQQQLPLDGCSTLGKNATITKNYQTLKTKLNVNFQNEFGLTCLHQSCISGTLEIARLLSECGAQIDLKDKNGNRALHYACQHGKLDLVCFLLQSGSDANEVNSHNGDSPLHVAIQHALTPLAANSQPNASEKIVSLLLSHGARTSLTIKNRTQQQSPLELACELGKTKLVELMLKWSLVNNMIDQIRDSSKNSLHLASKNGHDDVIRLLLIFNVVDVNYATNEGTALHEACRYGRYHTAKLLLESGLSTQTKNALDQTAIDVVIKQKVGNDLKCLIKEFAQSFVATATQAYLTNHAGALNFAPNESITVLEKQNQNWRGFILDKSTYTTRSGYFPSAFVRTNDDPQKTSQLSVCASNQLSKLTSSRPFVTSSTNSLLISGQTTTTTSTTTTTTATATNKLLTNEIDNVSIIENLNNSIEKDRDSSSSSVVYMSNSQLDKIQKHPLFSSFNANTAQTAVSSSSSSNNNNNPTVTGSSLSPSSSSSSSTISSTCSFTATMSPSSRLVARKNVSSLLRSGLNDSQITFNWLRDQQLEQYYENFVRAGYDLITIMKATPADLCAIGISDPSHRHMLKQNMNLIDIGELEAKLNDYLHQVESIDQLFKLIHLEQYMVAIKQHYKSLDDFLNTLVWEDLEEIGVRKLGHQKKLMFVCKKLKEIRSNQKDATVVNVSPPAATCVPIPISLNLAGDQSSASLTMTKSLENVHEPPVATMPMPMSKPTPPRRATLKSSQECLMVSFGNDTFKSVKGAHPPLPPRISSATSNKNYLNSLATLPRNSKRHARTSLENQSSNCENAKIIIGGVKLVSADLRTQTLQRPTSASSTSSSSSSAISPKSSSSSPPHSTSPVNNKSELVPPTPPPMPLMSILTMSDQTTVQKTSRRMLPFSNNTKLPAQFHNSSPTTALKQPLLLTEQPPVNRLNSILNRHHSNLLASMANKMPPPAPSQTARPEKNNVLNDIDIMLCDLNKQLDAMLDYEKAFK